MLWNTDPDTHRSVRSPAFYGPVALAAALTLVSCLSDPLWQQFHLIEANALNTSMTIGEWGACVRLTGNLTGLTGPDKWCTSAMSGFELFVNLNDTVFYNFPTGSGDDNLLGITQPAGTIQQIQVVKSSQTGLAWLHVVTALIALSVVLSLIVPPSWIGGGKSSLAQFQRSGILTLILAGFSFIMCIVTFALYFGMVTTIRNSLNAIPGIRANWSNSNVMWFILPCAILYLPPFAVVLLPTYVKPKDDDDESEPMAPLAAPGLPYGNQQHGKSQESFNSSGGASQYGANSPFPKVGAMYMGKDAK